MAYSFSLGGVRSEDKGMIINDVKRSLLSQAADRTFVIANKIGLHYQRSDLRSRDIKVEYTLTASAFNNVQTVVRDIAEFLDPTVGLQDLIFDDETDKKWRAVLDDESDFSQVIKFGQGTIKFFIPDGVALGTIDETENFVSDAVSFTRVGTAPSFPIINYTPSSAGTTITITLTTTGEFIQVDTSFSSGDTIQFTTEFGDVTVNGTSVLQDVTLSSDFFSLVRGTNSLTISSDATTSSADVTYTPRYL